MRLFEIKNPKFWGRGALPPPTVESRRVPPDTTYGIPHVPRFDRLYGTRSPRCFWTIWALQWDSQAERTICMLRALSVNTDRPRPPIDRLAFRVFTHRTATYIDAAVASLTCVDVSVATNTDSQVKSSQVAFNKWQWQSHKSYNIKTCSKWSNKM